MSYIIPLCLGFCASAAGSALFRLGRQELEKQAQDQEENDKIPFVLKRLTESSKIWQAVMWGSNMILALFLTAVYAAEPLEISRIVCLCTVLFVCAWTDCRAYLIFNKILLAALLICICIFLSEACLEPVNVRYTLIGSGISAAALLLAGLLCRVLVPGSVGFGDLKLFIILGLFLGADSTWSTIFYTLLASFAVSVCLLATKRASRKSVMPFAPFLLLGTLMSAFLNGV